jgi:hypothetical protein
MARMIRKQIVIDARREELLVRLAKERGLSQSELIRLAIDEMVEAQVARETDEKAREREDERRREAHEWLTAFFAEGLPLGTVDEHGERTWTREGLYDDRGSTRR